MYCRRISSGIWNRHSASICHCGDPYHTDTGNEILDCVFPDGISDPATLEAELDRIPGVVESGLFVGLAQICFVGEEDGSCTVLEL